MEVGGVQRGRWGKEGGARDAVREADGPTERLFSLLTDWLEE